MFDKFWRKSFLKRASIPLAIKKGWLLLVASFTKSLAFHLCDNKSRFRQTHYNVVLKFILLHETFVISETIREVLFGKQFVSKNLYLNCVILLNSCFDPIFLRHKGLSKLTFMFLMVRMYTLICILQSIQKFQKYIF